MSFRLRARQRLSNRMGCGHSSFWEAVSLGLSNAKWMKMRISYGLMMVGCRRMFIQECVLGNMMGLTFRVVGLVSTKCCMNPPAHILLKKLRRKFENGKHVTSETQTPHANMGYYTQKLCVRDQGLTRSNTPTSP